MSVLILLSAFIPLALAGVCPATETPESCYCERLLSNGPNIKMTCSQVTDSSLLSSALALNSGITWLNLIDCSLPSLPALPNTLVHLQIINSSISFISSQLTGASSFEGLNAFSVLTLKGVSDLSEWDWSQFHNLRNLRSISIENSLLPSLSFQFGQMGGNNPWSLSIINCRTRHIEPHALGSATLRKFVSRGNALSTLTVQMFDPGRNLVELELVGTGISSLTTNLPDNLRKLHALRVDYQFISILTPSHFSGANIISVITVSGPPGPCKCSLSFLRRHGLGGYDRCTVRTENGTIEFTMTDLFQQIC